MRLRNCPEPLATPTPDRVVLSFLLLQPAPSLLFPPRSGKRRCSDLHCCGHSQNSSRIWQRNRRRYPVLIRARASGLWLSRRPRALGTRGCSYVASKKVSGSPPGPPAMRSHGSPNEVRLPRYLTPASVSRPTSVVRGEGLPRRRERALC